MEFSYVLEGNPILKNIKIDLSNRKIAVITGVENTAFEIMGGVIAGLFPIEKEESFPQLEEVIKYFSGDLVVHSGKMPESGLYIGPDPDRHILFSKVKEEVYAQLGFNVDVQDVISKFNLGADFLSRKIMTLSGGEKVRVALSILFSKDTDCIVLHGVLPWLDDNGKHILMDEIERSLDSGIKVIMLEQEIDSFHDLDTEFYYFDGQTINKSSMDRILVRKKSLLSLASKIKKNIALEESKDVLLSFKNVYFDYNYKKNGNLLLNDIEFTIFNSRIYGLTGENGSGKSTIAKLITRILKPIKGSIIFEGGDLLSRSRGEIIDRICYVGQFPERQLVYGDVSQYKQKSKSDGNNLSLELLDEFFNEESSYPISTLNPLQLKLLLLFSSISKNTRLVILDEPTWGIDIDGQKKIAIIIDYLIGKIAGISILIISHDQKFLNEFSTNMLFLSQGKIKKLK